ncbi:MAG: HDOD domain-containing protein, partial [Gammaproteobacteria bacterium]|nr:HDOD domain-containing protein [Gammaproteobacteria bacterium]
IDIARQQAISLHQAERELLGFDYAQVGADLLSSWSLPESLIEIIGCQNEPDKADDYQLETAILNIGIAITRSAMADIPVTPETLAIDPVCWEITGLSVDDMAATKDDVDDQAGVAMDILFPRLSTTAH